MASCFGGVFRGVTARWIRAPYRATATPLLARRLTSSAHCAAPPVDMLPAPWRVTLDTNPDDCNFACTMCEQHSVYSGAQAARSAAGIRKRRMDPALVESLIAELTPLGLREVIPSTMGEPLMYAHFERIVAAVAARAPGVRLNLTTTGSFIAGPGGHSPASWASILLPILSDVKISWNGATAATQELIMRNSKFDLQLRNLRMLVKARDALAAAGGNRASITLQLTFMERNLAELPAIVRLGLAEGVDRIKGHHLWAHFREIKGDNMRRSAASVAAWNTTAAECRAVAEAQQLPNGARLKLEHFEDLDAAAVVGDAGAAPVDEDAECPFLGREAWVNHAGDFAPCCAPDEQRKTLGIFGNVAAPGGLMAIWNSPEYKDLVANYKSKPLCLGCHMRRAVKR